MGTGTGALSGARPGWLGALAAVVLALAAGVPSTGRADPPRANDAQRLIRRSGPLTVAVGATSGDGGAREMLQAELSDAIAHHPALRLGAQGATGRGAAALVVSARVRALTVQRVGADAIAQCELGVVVADGGGAVRAMLDARRVVRGAGGVPDEELQRLALRGAVAGALRNLVTQLGP